MSSKKTFADSNPGGLPGRKQGRESQDKAGVQKILQNVKHKEKPVFAFIKQILEEKIEPVQALKQVAQLKHVVIRVGNISTHDGKVLFKNISLQDRGQYSALSHREIFDYFIIETCVLLIKEFMEKRGNRPVLIDELYQHIEKRINTKDESVRKMIKQGQIIRSAGYRARFGKNNQIFVIPEPETENQLSDKKPITSYIEEQMGVLSGRELTRRLLIMAQERRAFIIHQVRKKQEEGRFLTVKTLVDAVQEEYPYRVTKEIIRRDIRTSPNLQSVRSYVITSDFDPSTLPKKSVKESPKAMQLRERRAWETQIVRDHQEIGNFMTITTLAKHIREQHVYPASENQIRYDIEHHRHLQIVNGYIVTADYNGPLPEKKMISSSRRKLDRKMFEYTLVKDRQERRRLFPIEELISIVQQQYSASGSTIEKDVAHSQDLQTINGFVFTASYNGPRPKKRLSEMRKKVLSRRLFMKEQAQKHQENGKPLTIPHAVRLIRKKIDPDFSEKGIYDDIRALKNLQLKDGVITVSSPDVLSM